MYKAILPVLAVCSVVAATPVKNHKHRHSVTTVSPTPVRKQAAGAAKAMPGKASKASARRKGTSRAPARSYQQAPTRDRYKEIQQALATKGYYHGEANGDWGSESAEALRRFQADQSLMPDGKINSLSLIALGLGPKRLTAKSDATLQPPAASPAAPVAPPAAAGVPPQ